MKSSNSFGISDKSMKLILHALRTFPDIEEARMFGSRALGCYRKGSDIDMAIYGSNLNEQTALSLSEQLNENLPIPYFIDVVAPQYTTNKNLIKHIERAGVVFYRKGHLSPNQSGLG